MPNTVTYRVNSTHSQQQTRSIERLNEDAWEDPDLEHVCENCRQLECRAEVFTAQGILCGTVESNGKYQPR
jgi:hypothetical protein